MKRKFIVGLIIFGMVFSTINIDFKNVKAQEEVIMFEDNFEGYSTNSFPSSGGWILKYNGKGDTYQKIVNTVSVSGNRSFQLWGYPNWSACAMKNFTTSSDILGYEVYVRTGELGSDRRIAYVGFYNENIGSWGTGIARVFFVGDGTIKVEDGSTIQTYESNRWYKVKVVLNINSKEYDVWINGVLKAENVYESDADKIKSFILVSEHAGIKTYFDDVKVFTVSQEKCEEGWNVSNLNLNKTTFSPGETVSGTVYYEVWNPSSCPACIQQIVVGIDNDAKECIYNGIPNTCPNKTTGTASFSFKAPQSPGSYDVVFGNFYEYTCSDAKAKFPGTKYKTLGIITVESSNPPNLNVTWHVPSQFEYEKPNPLWFKTCNSGGDADVEHEMWISGRSLGLVTWDIYSGGCITSGWKDNFYVHEEDIEDGYVTIRFWAKATNESGTDTYDETKKIPVVGMEGSIKVIVKDDSGNKLRDAEIRLDGSYKGKINSSGEYTISNLSPGSYTVKASKSGYEDDSESVYVESGKTKTIYLTLKEIPSPTTTPPPPNPWENLIAEHSDYLRSGDTVYFNDEIAQMYAPIFNIQWNAKPGPDKQLYRIINLSVKNYLIQYLQVYPKQTGLAVPHTLDWSIVCIYVNKDTKEVEKIMYDYGWIDRIYGCPPPNHSDDESRRDPKTEHCSAVIYWKEIPEDLKEENHVKLSICTSYHSVELNDSGSRIDVPLDRLYDDYIWYDIPKVDTTIFGMPLFSGGKLNPLGFDITCTWMMTKGLEEIDITNFRVTVLEDDVVVEFVSEPDAKVKIWLAYPIGSSSWGYHRVASGKTGSKYGDYVSSFSHSEIQKYDSNAMYVVVYKPTYGNVRDMKRGQKYYPIPISTSYTFSSAGETIDVKYNEYSPDKDPASDIIDNPENTPLQSVSETIILLIGGPLANSETAKYQEYFPVKVTNDYPGEHRGVIEVIDNPFGEGKIVLLAGSDREGTEAAVEIFKTLKELPDEPIIVDWNNGDPIII